MSESPRRILLEDELGTLPLGTVDELREKIADTLYGCYPDYSAGIAEANAFTILRVLGINT